MVAEAPPAFDHAALLVPLRRLDARLSDALTAAELSLAEADMPSRIAVLHDLLAEPPGHPRFIQARDAEEVALTADSGGRLDWVRRRFGLSRFALDVLLLALAPEIDRRYQRVFAVLREDAAQLRPDIDLALDLLCATAAEKFLHRSELAPESRAFAQGLLRIEADPTAISPPSLNGMLVPDVQLIAFLLGHDALPQGLARFCAMVPPVLPESGRGTTPAPGAELAAAMDHAAACGQPVRWRLTGETGGRVPTAATARSRHTGTPLLVADLRLAAGGSGDEAGDTAEDGPLRATLLQAGLRGATLCLIVDPHAPARTRRTVLAVMEGDGPCDIVLAGAGAWPLPATGAQAMATIEAPQSGRDDRRRCWRRELADASLKVSAREAGILASRFRSPPETIRAACLTVRAGRPVTATGSAFPALLRALKAGGEAALSGAARRLDTPVGWDGLVLPAEQSAQLHGLCAQVEHRHTVDEDWGFARGSPLGRGICALFAGPSGTGKTMAAGIVARALHLDLYRVDLSRIVSKYIGETEKNLDRIFTDAERADAVLFFDEADSLFGRRTEVRESHDRYANLEVGYLLQKMEEYDGLAILATNLRQHLDEAFTRRLRIVVEFPFPDAAQRLGIWRAVFPRDAPLAPDVDLEALARDVAVAGGNIRNIALGAAFLAAAEGDAIGQAHLLRAVRAEYAKLGRSWSGTDP